MIEITFFFSSFGGVNQLSSKWGIQAVGQPCVLTAEAQTAGVFFLFRMNACYAVVPSSHGKSSSWLFIYLHQSLDLWTQRRRQREGAERAQAKWLVARRWAVTVRPPLSLSRPISLFPRMPGMPPVFPCSNYCLRKLCQRAEIVLMRGPAAFASVIWWISLGTHKTRHTRGYVATSEPRGRWRLLLAPSCWPGGSHIILVRRRLKSIQLGWAGALCQGNLRGLNLSCIMPGLDSSTCVQDLHVLCSLQACLL